MIIFTACRFPLVCINSFCGMQSSHSGSENEGWLNKKLKIVLVVVLGFYICL